MTPEPLVGGFERVRVGKYVGRVDQCTEPGEHPHTGFIVACCGAHALKVVPTDPLCEWGGPGRNRKVPHAKDEEYRKLQAHETDQSPSWPRYLVTLKHGKQDEACGEHGEDKIGLVVPVAGSPKTGLDFDWAFDVERADKECSRVRTVLVTYLGNAMQEPTRRCLRLR
jgi:hypothetical protein